MPKRTKKAQYQFVTRPLKKLPTSIDWRTRSVRHEDDVCGVYGLIDLYTDSIVYIGSSVNIRRRYKQHVSALSNGTHFNRQLQEWFTKTSSEHPVPLSYVVIQRCEPAFLKHIEQAWLVIAVERGMPIDQ